MKRILQKPQYLLLLIGLLVPKISEADIWDTPSIKTYYSENKEYKLVVTPQIIPDKFYKWQYYKNKHPQTKKTLRRQEKFIQNISQQDTILTPCTGELFKITEKDSTLIWKRQFLNYDCPVYAIVANDGSSVATIDNWYSRGYGVNVFVVYNEKGEAKKTYKLEEISPYPLNDYLRSISSIYWNKELRYIDNDSIKIIFETEDERQTTKIYDVQDLEFEKNAP